MEKKNGRRTSHHPFCFTYNLQTESRRRRKQWHRQGPSQLRPKLRLIRRICRILCQALVRADRDQPNPVWRHFRTAARTDIAFFRCGVDRLLQASCLVDRV